MYPVPTIPVGLCRMKAIWPSATVGIQEACCEFWFHVTGVNPAFKFNAPFPTDCSVGFLRPVFNGIVAHPTGAVTGWWAFNDGNYTHSGPAGGSNPPFIYPNNLAPQWCPCFTRSTGILGGSYRGRIFGPPVPSNFFHRYKYTAAARARYRNSAIAMLHSFTSQGLTFNPVVFSPKLGTFAPLTNVKFLQIPSLVRKRRTLDYPYVRAPLQWPNIP